jgi:hypothetical protein
MVDKPGSGANQPAEEREITRPVDDEPAPRTEPQREAQQQELPLQPAEPQKPLAISPQDERRNKMYERFAERREEEVTGERAPPAEERAEPAAPKLRLKVNGNDIERSVDEIAKLIDMTPDEVRANEAAATRLAQKHIAADARLDEAKRVHRAAQQGRGQDLEDNRRPDPAPHQERAEPEDRDDGRQKEQPRDTSDALNFTSIAEIIQMEDPEKAGEALKDAISKAARAAATSIVNEEQLGERVRRDERDAANAIADFSAEHPDIVGLDSVIEAMKPGLVEECRIDIVKALRAEGDEEAASFVETAPKTWNRHIIDAHTNRRLAGDPNVRRIDKSLFEAALQRHLADLGQTTSHLPQDFAAQRYERKQSLQPQPRRASVPPARPAGRPPTQEEDRREGFELLRAARGRPSRPAIR